MWEKRYELVLGGGMVMKVEVVNDNTIKVNGKDLGEVLQEILDRLKSLEEKDTSRRHPSSWTI
jgi:hypothetical protein